MNIEQVKEYIESEGLNGRSREQFYVFRRHYLCWALYPLSGVNFRRSRKAIKPRPFHRITFDTQTRRVEDR
jgi:hypothetical protein